MVVSLIDSLIENGEAALIGDRVALSDATLRAIKGDKLDSLFEQTIEKRECAWAVDLTCGLIHDYDWTIDHRQTVKGVGDIELKAEMKQEEINDHFHRRYLRDLVVPVLNQLSQDLDDKKRADSGFIEDVQKVDDLTVIEVFPVAVELTEHKAGDTTRWLVQHNTPPTILQCLEEKRPDLLLTRIESQEHRDRWIPSEAQSLLERIESLWERVHTATYRNTPLPRRKEMERIAIEEIRAWMKAWREREIPYSDARLIDISVGPAEIQGSALAKVCRQNRKRLVILSSFVNEAYAEWFARLLNNLPPRSELLLLYGHANSQDSSEARATIESYAKKLREFLRDDIELLYAPTAKKTHEKIILGDDSTFMVGSWNACSSGPETLHQEATLTCRSGNVTKQLFSVLAEEVEAKEKEFIAKIRASLVETTGKNGHLLFRRLNALYYFMKYILSVSDDAKEILEWKKWRRQLLGLKDDLWTHFDSPLISIIRSEDLRDILVEQITNAKRSVLVSTDRVNPSGLDSSLARLLLSKRKLVRIVWGMEAPWWKFRDEPEVEEELGVAADTLRAFSGAHRATVHTSLKPMLNHSKLLIVDENRFLISGNNFLARGSEPDSESSKEIGLLVESPLLARRMLGQLMLHSREIRNNMSLEVGTFLPWDLFELVRQELEALWTDEEMTNKGDPKILDFAVQSRFRDFTSQGKIMGVNKNRFFPSDESLSERWEEAMRRAGKRWTGPRASETDSHYWDTFLLRAREMIGIQTLRDEKIGKVIVRPRQREASVAIWKNPESSESGQTERIAESKPETSRESKINRFEQENYVANFHIGSDANSDLSDEEPGQP